MASETTYTCDRCGESQKGDGGRSFLEQVGIHIGKVYGSLGPTTSFCRRVEWCRPCLVTMGLRDWASHIPTDPPAPDPKPTIEDLIREICEETVGNG